MVCANHQSEENRRVAVNAPSEHKYEFAHRVTRSAQLGQPSSAIKRMYTVCSFALPGARTHTHTPKEIHESNGLSFFVVVFVTLFSTVAFHFYRALFFSSMRRAPLMIKNSLKMHLGTVRQLKSCVNLASQLNSIYGILFSLLRAPACTQVRAHVVRLVRFILARFPAANRFHGERLSVCAKFTRIYATCTMQYVHIGIGRGS